MCFQKQRSSGKGVEKEEGRLCFESTAITKKKKPEKTCKVLWNGLSPSGGVGRGWGGVERGTFLGTRPGGRAVGQGR